jgi:Zn-dependent peptidase ImmA (M78 family)/transcriptional regulator with XRE-family HTH domain
MTTSIPGFNGHRLQQARIAMGLTGTSLADLLGVTRQAISRYESGEDSPRVEVFDRMRSILRQESHFFLRPLDYRLCPGTSFYRSMAAATKSARDKSEVWLLWVRELTSYLSGYIELLPVDLPVLDIPDDPVLVGMDQVERAAEDLRKYWKLGDGPIANLTEVGESKGLVIARYSIAAESLDAVSKWCMPENAPYIVMNADKSVAVRSRLDLAHEIGHMVLHRHVTDYQFRKTAHFKMFEDQAFRFGAALLLPEHSFLEDLYSISLDGLKAIKPKWKVSIAMMIERVRHLGMINDDQYRRLRINYSARQWNRREPLDDEILVECPTFLAKAVHLMVSQNIQTAEQIISASGFSREWIERLLSADLSHSDPLQPKILEFKRRA